MSHNLNFGAYRIGNAYVSSPDFYHRRCKDPNVIYHFGSLEVDFEPSDYTVVTRFPAEDVLEAIPGHVYGYRGKMYVFITNAADDIEMLSSALEITLQRIPDCIRSNDRSGGRTVDRHQQWVGKMTPFEQAAEGMGIDFTASNTLDACTKSPSVTRFRGIYLLDAEDAPSGRQECIHLRTQSYTEPHPSLQLKEKTLLGVRYRCNGGETFCGNSRTRKSTTHVIGNRVATTGGLLGNLFEGGPECSGFVDLCDVRKCTGPLMTGFLSRAIPIKTKKMSSCFSVRSTDDGVSVDQRVDDVRLNHVFIVYSAACRSFVFVCSVVITFTDILVDSRNHPQIPYLYGRQNGSIPFDTNIPCVLSMDTECLLHDTVVRNTTETLFRSVCFQESVTDRPTVSDFPLCTTPFFADRWRVIAMVAIMFAHESKAFALNRTMILWFDREFDRVLFESLLFSTAERIDDASYVNTYVKFQLTGTPFTGNVSESSFAGMLGCIDQLIRTRAVSYRSALTKIVRPPSPVELAIEELSLPLDETSNVTVARDVWVFINSKIDFSSMCTGDDTHLVRISTRDDHAMVR